MATPPLNQPPLLQHTLNALVENRTGARIPTIRADNTEWETHIPLKKGQWSFDFKEVPRDEAFLQLCFRQHHTKCDMFRFFVTPELINCMHLHKWEANHDYLYSSSRKGTFVPTVKAIYKFLAIAIRIYALQNSPKENTHNKNALRDNFKEANEHFKGLVEGDEGVGQSLCELLWRKFRFEEPEERYLSERFQEAVESLGQYVAGDEKLFKWTGESQWVRFCPGKDDKCGLWNYELCGLLENGLSFLIYVRWHRCETVLGGGVQCAEVMRDWGRIVKAKGTQEATILVADSYYLDVTGRAILQELEILYICALQSCRFQTLYRRANIISHHAGTTALLYSHELHEMFITHWVHSYSHDPWL
jgi:hypothetical protein